MPSQKEIDHANIRAVFGKARSEAELKQELRKYGFEPYVRGRNEGVSDINSGRKYRLRTLGLQQALLNARDRIAVYAERQNDLDQFQHSQPNRDRGRNA